MASETVTDPSHSSYLLQRFQSMREAGEGLDFVIKGEDKSFPIHSLVFASFSEMFKGMYNSNFDESTKKEAAFPTIPDDILGEIIDFVYSGTFTFAGEELIPVIEAAHYLQMPRLLKICEEQITGVLQPSNCLSLWRLGHRLDLGVITKEAKKMMITSHEEITQTQEFKEAVMSEITEILSTLAQNGVHNDALVQAVLLWTNHSPDRSVHMTELITNITFGKCTMKFLSKALSENAELLATHESVRKCMQAQVGTGPRDNLLVLIGRCSSDYELIMQRINSTNNYSVNAAEGRRDQQEPELTICKGEELEFSVLKVELPQSVEQKHSVCQVPQGVLVTGGLNSDMCELFDVSSKTWTSKASLLSWRAYHGSGYLSGQVFVVGGLLDFDVTGSVDFMDLDTNIWQHGPALPDTELTPQVVVCNFRLYVLLTLQGDFYCLDGDTKSWTKKSDIPTPSEGCSMAASDDKLFAAGGEININCVYTPASDTWCNLTGPTSGPTSVFSMQASLVFYKQKLLLFHGCEFGMEEYDINADRWSRTNWTVSTQLSPLRSTTLLSLLPHRLSLLGAFVFDSPI